jgi:deoxyribonuclease-4
VGCDVLQVFTQPPRQFAGPANGPFRDEQVQAFRKRLIERNIEAPVAHSSYLINLASPDETLWRRSLETFVCELQRAEQLGLFGVILHPGSYTTSSEEEGLRRVSEGLAEAIAQTNEAGVMCLLECTAGQGTNLGNRLEHLATILDAQPAPDRFGVCLDTCHLFAAGYPMGTEKEYRGTMRTLDKTVGIDRVKAIHLNDSKQPFGSRKDRHEHIGEGEMGLEPFRQLLNDRRFRSVPMYLETPKGKRGKQDLDRINLKTLRGLVE